MNKPHQKRSSFILHSDSLDILEHLTDEQSGRLFKAIQSYIKGSEVKLDAMLNIAFIPIKNQLDRDLEKYKNICERNRANGLMGGRPAKPKKPSGLSGNPKNPSEPKKAHSDSDSDSDSDNDNKKEKNKNTSINYDYFPSLPKKQLLNDWMKVRQLKKAAKTQTAIDGVGKELHKAVASGYSIDSCFTAMVEKSWAGFKASWMDNIDKGQLNHVESVRPDYKVL